MCDRPDNLAYFYGYPAGLLKWPIIYYYLPVGFEPNIQQIIGFMIDGIYGYVNVPVGAH
jgi:hypothetical protein